MRIERIRLDSSGGLSDEYLFSFSKVQHLYGLDPGKGESFRKRYDELSRRETSFSRSRLAGVLREFHSGELYHPAVEQNIRRLEKPGSVVVIGGQQAGLLAGPLYTVYKAISVIQLARREEERLGVPVIPVFWIAGEDHDLDEVDHIYVPGPEGRLTKHRLPLSEGGKRISAGHVLLDPKSVGIWLQELGRMLPDTEFKEDMLEELTRLAAEPVSLTRYFAKLLHRLFGRFGLIQIDSSFPPLRRLEGPFFERLIAENAALDEAVGHQIKQVEQMGHPSPLVLHPDCAHLFVYVVGERQLLLRAGGGFVTRDGRMRWSRRELLRMAREEPQRLSNNVVTRPLMQEFLFPTLSAVVGPGEIAYWGCLGQAFSAMDMTLPVLMPGCGITLIDRATERYLGLLGLSVEDIFSGLDQKKRQWIDERAPLNIQELFAGARKQVEGLYDSLIEQLSPLGPDMRRLGEKNRLRVMEQLNYLRGKAERMIRMRHETALRRFDHISLRCLPEGKLQERVYNIVPYWNEYGTEWVGRLAETPLSFFEHQVVFL
ncbi:MAG: bacillithiol biosynthesis cysteine-adding enzyme BshC [Planifilum fimeticola]